MGTGATDTKETGPTITPGSRPPPGGTTGINNMKVMPNIQIEDEPVGLEAWAEQEEDYVDFDAADYVDSPVALARMKARVKQIDLARQMQVPSSYISKLEHADQVPDEALQKVQGALQELGKP